MGHIEDDQPTPFLLEQGAPMIDMKVECQILASSSKEQLNSSPVLRHLYKSLVYLPFAHTEAGSVQTEELFVMWGLLYGQRINMGHLMIEFLERKSKKETSKLCYGGIITSLAIDLDCLHHKPRGRRGNN